MTPEPPLPPEADGEALDAAGPATREAAPSPPEELQPTRRGLGDTAAPLPGLSTTLTRTTGLRRAGDTTLLSAPAPAEAREIEVDDRLAECERKLESLEDRVRSLERGGTTGGSEQRWLVWVVFLLTLAVAWQLFRAGR